MLEQSVTHIDGRVACVTVDGTERSARVGRGIVASAA